MSESPIEPSTDPEARPTDQPEIVPSSAPDDGLRKISVEPSDEDSD